MEIGLRCLNMISLDTHCFLFICLKKHNMLLNTHKIITF